MTHPPPPSRVSLFAFLLPATWRRVQPLTAPTRTPWSCSPGTHPRAAPGPWVFSGLQLVPALFTLESRLYPCKSPALRAPGPPRQSASSPPLGGSGKGKGAGSSGGVTAPARTSASCSLASVPRASWLFRLGRRRRIEAPGRWWGGLPPSSPLSTQEEPLRPTLLLAALAAGPARNWPWSLRLGLRAHTPPGSLYCS